MKSFDGKLYIFETGPKHLYKNEIQCQAVCNKLVLDPIPDELKDLKKLEVLISKRVLFKKIAVLCGKGGFSKIKGSICNVPIEAAKICNILTRLAVSNESLNKSIKIDKVSHKSIVVKLKRDLKYRGRVYFEPVRPHTIYQVLTYWKSHNKFYEAISIAKSLASEEMFRFSGILEMQGENVSVTEKIISDGKEMNESINAESINDTGTEYASAEDPLDMHKTASFETLVSEIPNIINGENFTI